MTNLEKFEEVFGIKLDPFEAQYIDFPCGCVDYEFCKMYECDGNEESDCPAAKNFWSREYVERPKLNTDLEWRIKKLYHLLK